MDLSDINITRIFIQVLIYITIWQNHIKIIKFSAVKHCSAVHQEKKLFTHVNEKLFISVFYQFILEVKVTVEQNDFIFHV